ncbi:glycosyltransferase family 2 protein [Candidatus Methylopumilus universalis]|uniref:glycosyltransferase family 2 protein n=1 Tax=Candidatus Methylopumilus universalis TaxID=2588536 RepID=UPI00111D2C03|nr:glycosyltransferase family 2 protein [Candidatus Methylopumilus universalis]QDC88123.1 glycosyltransferase family 2 protein [Candidatus Methylopumilus universalis]
MKSSFKKPPRIAILMCTYNGDQFLEEQLDSIESQDYKNWTLYVNDDGSKDNTLNILKRYQKKWGVKKLIIRCGPQKGFCQNFLQIINDPKIKADFYFLSDQDDVWMPHKLSHTLQKLSKLDALKPNLYCARTTYISSNLKYILGYSEVFLKPLSFKNAIVQSIAGGNTMAFNNHLKKIAQKYPKAHVVSHDWWLYILNELVGGQTFYDPESTILYRQHNKSLIGANTGLIAKLRRFKMLLNGKYREYNTQHFEVFNKFNKDGLRRNLEIIDRFFALRDKPLKDRLLIIKEMGIYRQTFDTHLGLYLGLILKKI